MGTSNSGWKGARPKPLIKLRLEDLLKTDRKSIKVSRHAIRPFVAVTSHSSPVAGVGGAEGVNRHIFSRSFEKLKKIDQIEKRRKRDTEKSAKNFLLYVRF